MAPSARFGAPRHISRRLLHPPFAPSGREAEAQGYSREAIAAIIAYLIAEHDVHRFVGVAASLNEASTRVLRSLGFRQEGHFRQSFLSNGEWLDDEYYVLLASEWRGRGASAPAHDQPVDEQDYDRA